MDNLYTTSLMRRYVAVVFCRQLLREERYKNGLCRSGPQVEIPNIDIRGGLGRLALFLMATGLHTILVNGSMSGCVFVPDNEQMQVIDTVLKGIGASHAISHIIISVVFRTRTPQIVETTNRALLCQLNDNQRFEL